MTPTSPPPAAGLVPMLAWLIPIFGVLVWVLILPSTRTLIRKKTEKISKLKEETETPESKEPSPSTPRLRTEDPEIAGFDREVVRAKFARPHTKAPH